VPYLVSVRDPYDYLSPHHVWPTTVLTAARVGEVLGVHGVRDIVVLRNSSGRASAVVVTTSRGRRRFPGQLLRTKFHLGSTDFEVRAMQLDAVAARTEFGGRVRVTGFVRGLGRARLQQLGVAGWVTVRSVRPAPDGRFAITLRALRSTQLRLAYNGLAGAAEPLGVVPRVELREVDGRLHVRVAPSLPLRVERLTHKQWRAVARGRGRFDRRLGPGSYRVSVAGGREYLPAVSAPISLRAV
jgi:hypothetical protein